MTFLPPAAPTSLVPTSGASNGAIVTPVLIARMAYHIWERSGRPDRSDACWSQAERELRNRVNPPETPSAIG